MQRLPEFEHVVYEICEEDAILNYSGIADRIAPPIPVYKTDGKFMKIPMGEFSRVSEDGGRRSKDGTFNSSGYSIDKDEFDTEEFGEEARVDNVSQRENIEWLDELLFAGKTARSKVQNNREKRVADSIQDLTKYSAGQKIANAITWDNKGSAVIYDYFHEASEKTRLAFGLRKSGLAVLMTENQVNYAMQTDEIKANSKYTLNIETMDLSAQVGYLRSYLGVKEIHLATGMYNEGGVEGALQFRDFWSDHNIYLYLPPQPGINNWKTPAFARQPVWMGFNGGKMMYEVYGEYKNDSTWVRAREYAGVKVDHKWAAVITGVLA